jgi:hypothetical protein
MPPKIQVGSRVSVLATFFDVPGEPKWSQNQFGTRWKSARVTGDVIDRSPGRNKWTVQFDDGDVVENLNYQQLRVEEGLDHDDGDGSDVSDEANVLNDRVSEASEVEEDRSGARSDSDHGTAASQTAGDSASDPESVLDTGALQIEPPAITVHVDGVVSVGPKNDKVTWSRCDVPGGVTIDARTAPRDKGRLLGMELDATTSVFDLLWHLMPFSIRHWVDVTNSVARKERERAKRKWRDITISEMILFFGIFVGACAHMYGSLDELFSTESDSIFPPANLQRYGIELNRFREILQYISCADPLDVSVNTNDKWWPVRGLINAFNENRKVKFHASWIVAVDELMSAFKGKGMPHTSFVPRKPEPIGCEMKCLSDGLLGVMMFLELQEGKDTMANLTHHTQLGATAACTLRIAESASINGRCLVGDSWFASVRTAVALMKVGVFFIGNVKTAHGKFPKQTLKEEGKGLPRGDTVVYTATVDGVSLNAVGWKCGKVKTVQTFITTCGTSTTANTMAHCDSQDVYGNLLTEHFKRPVIAELYASAAGSIDWHNRSRQGELALEKRWVTQKWTLRVMTTVIAICVTDAFLLAREFIHEFEDVSVVHFAKCFSKRAVEKAAALIISENPVAAIVTVPRASCYLASYGRKEMVSSVTGEAYTKQIQRYCEVCNALTSFFCAVCNIPLCGQHKSCVGEHAKNPMRRWTRSVGTKRRRHNE